MNIGKPETIATDEAIKKFAVGYLRPGHVLWLLGRKSPPPKLHRLKWALRRAIQLGNGAADALHKHGAIMGDHNRKHWEDAKRFWSFVVATGIGYIDHLEAIESANSTT